jgi:hypothetical protein
MSLDEWDQIEAQVRGAVPVRDDFVSIPFPRLAATSDAQIAAAVESYKREAAIIDARLACPVTCAFKGMALSDLCDQLRAETGIRLETGRSVADEKVTLFCKEMPLREVMRQLSRPFGYTWIRTGKPGEHRYELVQDLRSQLLEEELRNRDRHAALLALDREMERYRAYIGLSPDEVLSRARTPPPEEKKLLENLAPWGWGPAQMYFRLSPQDLAALRAGQTLRFSTDPKPGEPSLPPEIARGVLQSLRDMRIRSRDGHFTVGDENSVPDGLPPASIPEAHALVTLRMDHSELGQFSLDGGSGVRLTSPQQDTAPSTSVGLAMGRSPLSRRRPSTVESARLTSDPALHRRVSVQPHSPRRPTTPNHQPQPNTDPKVTSADVLEALHRSTSLPIVADYYTRLYPAAAVTLSSRPLSEALDQLADAMRLNWNKEGSWLQFRSISYYDDRLKEIPNRLLHRWAASRQQHGMLTLDDLIEIAHLSDAQLDSRIVAEGVKECYGLWEWDLARNRANGEFRPHLRFLGELTPAQREEAMSATGLPFRRMSLAQQQQFIARVGPTLRSLEMLAGAALRVQYTQPGWFRWEAPGTLTVSPVLERKREDALKAVLRLDPRADGARIVPTELAITVLYTWGSQDLGRGSLAMRVTPQYTSVRADSNE